MSEPRRQELIREVFVLSFRNLCAEAEARAMLDYALECSIFRPFVLPPELKNVEDNSWSGKFIAALAEREQSDLSAIVADDEWSGGRNHKEINT